MTIIIIFIGAVLVIDFLKKVNSTYIKYKNLEDLPPVIDELGKKVTDMTSQYKKSLNEISQQFAQYKMSVDGMTEQIQRERDNLNKIVSEIMEINNFLYDNIFDVANILEEMDRNGKEISNEDLSNALRAMCVDAEHTREFANKYKQEYEEKKENYIKKISTDINRGFTQ